MTRNTTGLNPEHARALALVRAAKRRKLRAGGTAELTDAELDAVLAPVPCRRTRLRLGGRVTVPGDALASVRGGDA
jgi:hypothetical protein